MIMFTSDTVTVITAATGHWNLAKCIESVQKQTFPNVEHWVIADGEERLATVQSCFPSPTGHPHRLITLPHPTGKDNWCGHRIYAAASFLVNTEFLCFLDEDNWFEPEHIASLIAELRDTQSTWAFSLRNIVDAAGKFVVKDICESLGHLHHVFNNRNEHLIDTNCYLLPREMAVRCAPIWYAPTGHGSNSPDRAMCRTALRDFPKVCSNRRHTVNYTVGTRGDRSVSGEFFIAGFQAMRMAYPGGMPWDR